ncbi:MAG: hypothetical protein JJE52_01625 [Acidimicrobiia bacterium]|nr:hypothetical protein [Acidimicrobiia bacterium]
MPELDKGQDQQRREQLATAAVIGALAGAALTAHRGRRVATVGAAIGATARRVRSRGPSSPAA